MRELPALAYFTPVSLAAATGGDILTAGAAPIRGAAVDSRRIEHGNAFFALPGERTDGHRFVVDAARRGAAALIVRTPPDEAELATLSQLRGGGPAVVVVDDALAALHRAAAAWRAMFDPLVVGVTGSLAKTSTKEQIAEVLSGSFSVLRNRANENNEIGLPLTVLRLGPEHEVAVLEMGMYERGDIRVLAELARPSIGVVTAVRPTHLARSGSIEAIELGKRELIDALPDGGTAVLNADDPRVSAMARERGDQLTVRRYGFSADADVTADGVESRAAQGMRFVLRAGGEELEAVIPALGRHSVHNALAAAAVGLAAGLSLAQVVAGLSRPFSVPHRSVLLEAGEWQLLDDTYNAAPDSMVAALDLLASLPGRHVSVLGEMLELGDEAVAAHETVASHAARTADVLVAVGPMAALYADAASRAGMATSAIFRAADREQALATLGRVLRPGDVVLVKASRGAELDLLVDELRRLAAAEPVA